VSLEDLLVRTIGAIEAEGVPYMVTGSLASSFHGEYRATRDIDIVIDPSPSQLDRLVDRLRAAGMYVDPETARIALRERGQFNAVDAELKVDLIIHKRDAFSTSEFERRGRAQLLSVEADMVTVEDLILAKLVWARELDSERQLRDIAGMINVAGNSLDREYIARWADGFGVAEAWRRLDVGPGTPSGA
jgi:predicted nucleotidyltransferase